MLTAVLPVEAKPTGTIHLYSACFLSGIKYKHSRFRDARTLWGNQSSAATSNLCSCPPSYSRLEVALEVCKCPLWDFLCVLTWPLSKLLDSSEYNKHYKICRNLVV